MSKILCAGADCTGEGIAKKKGISGFFCIPCRGYDPPGPCDKVITVDMSDGKDPISAPCGVEDDTMAWTTPSGVAIVRCHKHRKSHDLIREPELGYCRE